MEPRNLALAKIEAAARPRHGRAAQASTDVPFAYTAVAALAPAILLALIVVVASSMATV